jgi:hypothetical protein
MRFSAGLTGQTGDFQEGHELDAKTAKKIPAKMIGYSVPPSDCSNAFD